MKGSRLNRCLTPQPHRLKQSMENVTETFGLNWQLLPVISQEAVSVFHFFLGYFRLFYTCWIVCFMKKWLISMIVSYKFLLTSLYPILFLSSNLNIISPQMFSYKKMRILFFYPVLVIPFKAEHFSNWNNYIAVSHLYL